MTTLLAIFFLGLLGLYAFVSSPVPSTWGKRIILFLSGTGLTAGAIILVRIEQEAIIDFLTSDYALTGPFGAQMAASIFVFGAGWFVFIVSSIRTERKRTTQFDQLWYSAEQPKEEIKVFRPWPSLLIWIPVVALLAVVWIVPLRLGDVGSELSTSPTTTATAIATTVPTSTPTQRAKPTDTPNPTSTLTATLEPTATPANTNPNMPPLACDGEWMHEKPFKIGEIRQALERCPDGSVLLHYPDTKTEPQLFEGMSIMTTVAPYRLEFTLERDGSITVNGVPFTEWFESQGGE